MRLALPQYLLPVPLQIIQVIHQVEEQVEFWQPPFRDNVAMALRALASSGSHERRDNRWTASQLPHARRRSEPSVKHFCCALQENSTKDWVGSHA